MTENEAIKILKRDLQIQVKNNALPDGIEAAEMAIQALEEVQRYQEIGNKKWYRMKKRTRLKGKKLSVCNKRLFADFGGIGYYKILKIYDWKEYCKSAETLSGSHWFQHSMAKIRTESNVIMKIPFIELGMKSVYADSGERVLKG